MQKIDVINVCLSLKEDETQNPDPGIEYVFQSEKQTPPPLLTKQSIPTNIPPGRFGKMKQEKRLDTCFWGGTASMSCGYGLTGSINEWTRCHTLSELNNEDSRKWLVVVCGSQRLLHRTHNSKSQLRPQTQDPETTHQ